MKRIFVLLLAMVLALTGCAGKKKAKDILIYGAKKFADLNTCYKVEYEKLQVLRKEVQELEQRRKQDF